MSVFFISISSGLPLQFDPTILSATFLCAVVGNRGASPVPAGAKALGCYALTCQPIGNGLGSSFTQPLVIGLRATIIRVAGNE
ncbi:hypothetical protein ATO46_06870 [Aeromonas schubertii]|nr:hypothetical protein ATO46_06870 [Aeromonas schubertii]